MSRVAEQAAFLLDVCKLVQYATEKGYTVTGGELARPVEMQELYVRTGRSTTMKSRHLDRMAVDLFFFKDGKLTYETDDLGLYWQSLSTKNTAGMFWKSFKDAPHFERRA